MVNRNQNLPYGENHVYVKNEIKVKSFTNQFYLKIN